jgi:hypothetical protein
MTPKRRTQDRVERSAPVRAFAMLAATVALFLQIFVVQTHTHVQPPLGSWGVTETTSFHADGDGHNHTHVELAHDKVGCIVCAVHATTGSATLAGAAILYAAHNAAYETAARAIRRAPLAITHSWQSRAPPLAL